jgi:predicted flap endonuclease-1-like 5' DNA nuclease
VSTRSLPDDAFSGGLPKEIGRPANAALVALGVTTLAQVAEMTEQELLAIHGVGPKAVAVLAAELEHAGLGFAG